MSHTPAPWARWGKFGQEIIRLWPKDYDNTGPADIENIALVKKGEDRAANAALIAAAPELLDALECLIERCSDGDVGEFFEADIHKYQAIQTALSVCGAARGGKR